MKAVLLVFFGGGVGSVLRFALGKLMNSHASGIPFGTFAANILASLLIGIVLGLAARNGNISENTLLLVATGFCGGFTTFSTFAYENHIFLRDGNLGLFALYALGSLLLGFAAVFVGIWLVRLF